MEPVADRRGNRQTQGSSGGGEAARYRWVTDQAELDEIVAGLAALDRYALDTEFHRERTYYPKLALVQVAWESDAGVEIALLDPLALDVGTLAKPFASEAVCVLHAAQQDLDVLAHAVGVVPEHIFDTQLAAGFVGYGTPSLVALLQKEIGVTPPKGDRLTDWLRRPLSEAQQRYAAADVEFLLDLHTRLVAQLDESGRRAWAEEACEELRRRPVGGAEPDEAWLRLKDARSLRTPARGIARALAAWRERRAMRSDVPVRQVLPDLAVLGIAQRAPTTVADLAQARGVDERHTRGAIAEEILAAVREGRTSAPPEAPRSSEELDRQLRPAVTLISAWVSQLARDERIDTALLATRADIVALLRGDPDARLARGWRAELVGDAVGRLLDGHAGLTFDRAGHLRLIDVPG